MLPGTVHPAELADQLAQLRMHPGEVIGQMVEAFVPRASEVDQDKDRRLSNVATTLAECVSIHSAATWLIDNQPWDFFAVYYDAIDHFCHGFMRYHPPRQAHIPEADYEIYKDVVSSAYRFHDQILGRLLDSIGAETTVIVMSDHGFHPDHLRPKAIPQIPAGPAIEHRDFGILTIQGPGIKWDEFLHGASVLDITPTLLTLFGLPVGADMDGKVLTAAFEHPPEVTAISSWEEVPGDDGRHPPHTRLDPVAARESLEQLVALGYIERPDENREKAVSNTIAELRYNLGQAYQDADRHSEAADIFRQLRHSDPDEQRYAVHLFVSCQALGLTDEMAGIVDDMDGRRRQLYEQSRVHVKEYTALIRERFEERKAKLAAAKEQAVAAEASSPGDPVPAEEALAEAALAEGAPSNQAGPPPAKPTGLGPLLTQPEREEFAAWRNLNHFQPPVVDFLKAQILSRGRLYGQALESLQRVQEADLARPGLYLQTADLYQKMGRWEEAEQTYRKALHVDPDNPHAHLGMARVGLRQRDFAAAAQSALDSIQRLYQYPMAHFLLGVALTGLKDYTRAAEAYQVALSLNPNFPQAHLRLALLLRQRLQDPAGSAEHLRLFRELRSRTGPGRQGLPAKTTVKEPVGPSAPSASPPVATPIDLPELGEAVVVVSGLPRSGTSMIMQMLAAGGLPILTDGLRGPDTDNPRGYFEDERVKHLHKDAAWLTEARGRAIKIVAPLLPYLPSGLACRVIFIERHLSEVLASQDQMLERRGEQVQHTPERQTRLCDEYSRQVQALKVLLARRPGLDVLFLKREEILRDSRAAAEAMNRFLGGTYNVAAMAAEVDPQLHRQRW